MTFRLHFRTRNMKTYLPFGKRAFKTRTEALFFLNSFRRKNKVVVKKTGAKFRISTKSVKRRAVKRKVVRKRTTKRKATIRKPTRKKRRKKRKTIRYF